MSWKLPLNQIGSGTTFVLGKQIANSRFREIALDLKQHVWLSEILKELECSPDNSQSHFNLQLNVEKQSEAYRVKAHLQMIPKLECVRSLTQFHSEVETEAEALFFRAEENKGGGEHEISESEMESYEHDGAGLVLSDFVTDLIYTSLPDFPLCQPQCRGLCSECGCNLNDVKSCGLAEETSATSDCPNIHFFQ
jgi:uncharacterized metal-binding protein YceD (DUF177 family)